MKESTIIKNYEAANHEMSGGILVTGNYPGRARNNAELIQDIEMAMSLLPGKIRSISHWEPKLNHHR